METLFVALRALLVVGSMVVVAATSLSALRTFVLPRAANTHQLVAAGVPVRPDPDECWQAFAGWRVNYDSVLLGLASVTMAPLSPWSSDRSPAFRSPLLRRRAVRSHRSALARQKSRNESQ